MVNRSQEETMRVIEAARILIKRAQQALEPKLRVFLDDDVDAEDRQRWAKEFRADIWVTTPEEVIDLLKSGRVSAVSLDRDLGLEPDETRNGYTVAKFIEEGAFDGTIPRLEWRVHSMNMVDKPKMVAALKNADRFWSAHEQKEAESDEPKAD